uniref:Response regulator receiver modulated diguanylate cyclase/phosphodiesterase with PAS/PAC sensor(S) n=1 Tax=Cyanothece sp. (strain PCC 7425 / ATCC 29141) TaxID=395961 RepID=B8HRI7_CYAP4
MSSVPGLNGSTPAYPGLQILLIADPTLAVLLQPLLAQSLLEPVQIVPIHPPEAALAQLHQADRSELILLDLALSENLDCLSTLHQHAPHVPILVLLEESQTGIAEQTLSAGATDYLFKSELTPSLLRRSLRYILHGTEFQQVEANLRQSEARFFAAAEASLDALFILQSYRHPEQNQIIDFVCTDVNSRGEKLLGKPRQAILGRFLSELLPVDSSKQLIQKYTLVVETGQVLEEELPVNITPLPITWLHHQIVPLGDGIAITARDISERKQKEAELHRQAFYDPLTELPNRTYFMNRLTKVLERAGRRQDFHYAVFFLDLDRFKVVNDSLGHLLGDEFLKAIARRLSSCLREEDMVARLGGDEFAILLEELSNPDIVHRIAERLQRVLSAPFTLKQHELFTTASIGIALGTSYYEQPEAILRDADIAMYQAKTQGKARHIIFDQAMHTRAVKRWQLESDLRWAIERREFCLVYQPIVSIQTERLIGFEALVRWHHPQRGWISPAEFISVAEETGLIIPLGHWVLWEGCRQLRQWQSQFNLSPTAEPPLTVSVNLSSKQFCQPDLIHYIQQVLQQTGMEGTCLKLELTESILMENLSTATSLLVQLKELGIQLALDDFGTGYSSLSYLHRFPLDVLKIDRSFINGIEAETENLEIVRTILSLARSLNLQVVAEGVETQAQLDHLQALQCGYAQGYLISRPLTPEKTEQFLQEYLQSRGKDPESSEQGQEEGSDQANDSPYPSRAA